jgi:hypothetical protein
MFNQLRKTIKSAKREWAQQVLDDAEDPNVMWRLAGVRKGRVSKLFPPLRDPSGNWVEDAEGKLSLLRERFFPATPAHIETIQPDQ